ncbi:MAG: hypothetical protein Q4E24_01860 [bacterium]|nr:hypothetical protein [bacterium]
MKRIAALIGAIFLLGLYILTIVFAFSGSPNSKNWLMACIFATVAIPVILYAWILAAKYFKKNDSKDQKES